MHFNTDHGILYGLNGWGGYGKVTCCCNINFNTMM